MNILGIIINKFLQYVSIVITKGPFRLSFRSLSLIFANYLENHLSASDQSVELWAADLPETPQLCLSRVSIEMSCRTYKTIECKSLA